MKKRSTCEKDGTEKQRRERGKQRERERKRDRLVFLSRLCGMTSLCTAAVFVNQGQGCLLGNFSGRKEGRRGEERKEEKKKKARKRKRGERAETLSSNSRKWVDPDRGRLCSLCGFNESTVFRTRRGTRELA